MSQNLKKWIAAICVTGNWKIPQQLLRVFTFTHYSNYLLVILPLMGSAVQRIEMSWSGTGSRGAGEQGSQNTQKLEEGLRKIGFI